MTEETMGQTRLCLKRVALPTDGDGRRCERYGVYEKWRQ